MQKTPQWIWQHPAYPNFTYDKEMIENLLLEVAKAQGELSGTIKHLNTQEQHRLFTNNLLDEGHLQLFYRRRDTTKFKCKSITKKTV